MAWKTEERLLNTYIPWDDYVADDVLMLDDGSVLAALQVDGLPFETTGDEQINYQHNRLEEILREQAEDGLIYHALQCRGLADPSLYPGGSFASDFAAGLDQHYREKLFGNRDMSMWWNQSFLVVHLSPRVSGVYALNQFLPRRWRVASGGAPSARIDRLQRILGILTEELRDYRPRRLGIVERGRRFFSEIAEAVTFALTGYWRPVPLTTSGAAAIFSEPFIIGPEAFEIRMPHASSWGACLSMHDFPWQTEPGQFDRFLSASYRHTVFHAYRALSVTDALALTNRKQNRSKQAGDKAIEQARDLTTLAGLIAGNRIGVGEHAFALTVFVDDPDKLSQAVRAAWADLSYGGVKIEREATAGLEAVLFSMIPGNHRLRGRQAAISSRNFAAFTALHNYPLGARQGFWGDPIAMMRTSGGTPFLYHFHTGGVGNTLITGESGAGKSVLIGFLLCQAQRAGAQLLVWDKDSGLKVLVLALGGRYLSLTNAPGLGTGLAPLKRLTNSDEDRAFLADLLRACIATPQPYDLTPEEDRRLNIALRAVMALPPEQRCLGEIRAFLGTSRDGAGARLEKWCAGHEYGWIIDCAHDVVDLQNAVLGFDQSDLLEDPVAAGAAMAVLFHYTGKLVDGRRLVIALDEIWNALRIALFAAIIHNGLKTYRKFNAPILLGTQSARDGLDSPIGHTIREQCPNQFYGSNPGAVWADLGSAGMNLTPKMFEIVRALPKGRGHFLLRQGSAANVVQIPLSGLDEVKIISGTGEGLKALARLQKNNEAMSGMALVKSYLDEEIAA